LRGRITVHTEYRLDNPVQIDGAGQHVWNPISPHARVELDFGSPALRWSGDGYLDSNIGHEPLENRFRFWDWSRGRSGPNETTILYNTDLYDGRKRRIAMRISDTGEVSLPQSPDLTDLPPTPIFRIARRTGGSGADTPRVIRTLEDTPFYSRSVIESTVFGQRFPAIHESLSGPRLRSPVVKMMLPFRMPRRA
jgi:carotenoid 1,2-hydratase